MKSHVSVIALTAAVSLRSIVVAEPQDAFVVSADSLAVNGTVVLRDGWRFKAGDDPAWADPDLDDDTWEPSPPWVTADTDWPGIGWFRLQLDVPPRLRNIPLALEISQLAAAEYYLDGQLLRSLGRVDPSGGDQSALLLIELAVPVPVVFDAGPRHVVAVRFAYHPPENYRFRDHPQHALGGFEISLSDPDAVLAKRNEVLLGETRMHIFIAAAALTIAVLHLLLFAFYPKLTGHLYYALFTTMAAVLAYLPLYFNTTTDLNHFAMLMRTMQVILVLISVTGLRFLYAIFYDKMPKVFWFWLGAGILVAVVFWNGPMNRFFVFNLVTFAEILRVLVLAVIRRRPYAWLIALGVAAFILASAFQIVMEIVSPGQGDGPEYYLYGLLLMLILMSVYLGLSYARINKDLARKLDEVERLSAERLEQERRAKEQEMERMRLEADNALKALELEDAHKRQAVLDELALTNQELRQTQAQLVQSEKMASLGNLVAGVAHEINTPVGAISSMHNTLVRAVGRLKTSIKEISPGAYEEDAKLQGTIRVIEDANDVIQSGSDRVTTIVRRLRSFARLDEAELKTVDIHEGLEDTLTLMHHELKHNITVHRNYGKVPPIACYPGQLNQVFLNLLVNARQAIEGDGEITITTYKKKDKVHVKIKDTGRGIPKDRVGKIFDPGFTTKGVGVGTGLGLSICYRIIQDHRGEIHVESEAGKGSTFTIILPVDLE
jgi:signal transduction histidine kinase